MDPNAAPVPGLISSLEAMIQASVTSVLDRRLGLAGGDLDTQIQTAVAAALDRRLGPAVGSLGNRMTSLVEQRLGSAVSTLNFRVNKSVTAALEQRLGPAGSALTAQITFTAAAPPSVLASAALPKVQVSGLMNGTKETNRACPIEEELGGTQPIRSGASTGYEQPTQEQGQDNSGQEKEQPAQKLSPAKPPSDTGPIEKEKVAQEPNATGQEASKTTSAESGNEISLPVVMSAQSNESISKQTASSQTGASETAVYPLFTDGPSKSNAGLSAVHTAKPGSKTTEPSIGANKNPAKRKTNQTDEGKKANDTGESDSSQSEEEVDSGKRKRKRAKVKLDPPGYTNGPPIKFRRVSPKLTACAKSRGYPRVIDLKSFTEASNKQSLTMADVVATVLFNYDPLSLHAFMDIDTHPRFHFIRKESNRKARNFVIERRRESYGVVVEVCGPQRITVPNALIP